MLNSCYPISNLLPLIESKISEIDILRKEKDYVFIENPLGSLKEKATVQINFGRCAGHSTLALNILRKHSNSVLLVYTKRNKEDVQKNSYLICDDYERIDLFTHKNLDIQDKIVIVDLGCFLSKKALENIYKKNPKMVILLG